MKQREKPCEEVDTEMSPVIPDPTITTAPSP